MPTETLQVIKYLITTQAKSRQNAAGIFKTYKLETYITLLINFENVCYNSDPIVQVVNCSFYRFFLVLGLSKKYIMAAFPSARFSSSAWSFVSVSGRIFISVPYQNSSAAVKVTELLPLPAAESHVVSADDSG